MNRFVIERKEGMYHKDLDVWKESIKLVKEIYTITKDFPSSELYGLTNQMRRCAVSIPSNLAEGSARFSNKDKIRFIEISLGSLAELETQIIISQELKFIKEGNQTLEQIKRLNAMYMGLINHLKNS